MKYELIVFDWEGTLFNSPQNSLFEGVLPLLAELKKQHLRLAVATGKSRRGLDQSLTMTQLDGVFDSTRTADETASKPHPRMLLELMDELQISPERTVMVGDTTHDLLLAANAGCDSVAVSYGAQGVDAFAAFAPVLVAHSVRELREFLSPSS